MVRWSLPDSNFSLICAAIVFVVLLASMPIAGQGPTVREDSSFRTPFGHPDLQGVWARVSLIPLERPAECETDTIEIDRRLGVIKCLQAAGRAALTDEEVKELERKAAESQSTETTLTDSLEAGRVGTYNNVFRELPTTVTGAKQTSLIIDPPDGKIPPMTPAGERMEAEHRAATVSPAGPEDHSLSVRCLAGIYQGPPMVPGSWYNNNFEVFQTPEYVVLHLEMVHEPRIIPLDGRPHPSIPQWRGTSRGHWEGETLVVETKNFIPALGGGFTSRDEHLEVVERFTRVDANTLRYVATVNDPTVWTKPWTISYEMQKKEGLDGLLFEYSCHEGNAGAGGVPSIMSSMLGAAREREKAGPEVPATKP